MNNIVVFCGTRNVYSTMEVAAKSLLCHTPVDHIHFLIEDETYPGYLPDIISVQDVSKQPWFDPNGPNYFSNWTYMAFMRLAFAKIFPQYDQVLYLDTDTLVLQDISRLLSTDLGDRLFAMVREDNVEIPLEICNAFSIFPSGLAAFRSDNPRPEFSIRPYYNNGVLLMNLRLLRETGMDDQLIDELNRNKHDYPDQDVINLMCHDKIMELPTEYNAIPALFPDFPHERIRIKHFASDKPLWKSSLWQQYRRLTWDAVMDKQHELKGEHYGRQ